MDGTNQIVMRAVTYFDDLAKQWPMLVSTVIACPFVYLWMFWPAPESLVAMFMFKTVSVLGAVGLLLLLPISGMIAGPFGNLSHLPRVVGACAALVTGALLAVRLYAHPIDLGMAFIQSHVEIDIAVAAGFAIILFIFNFGRTLFILNYEAPSALPVAHQSVQQSRRAHDVWRTAVHEAGHTMMFAALSSIPQDLSVSVEDKIPPTGGRLGEVRYSTGVPNTPASLRWQMIKYVAGSRAEWVVFGDCEAGAQSDYRAWMAAATVFLGSGFGESFYIEPQGDAQIAHNRAVLNDLKAHCESDADAFLTTNRDLLLELAQTIASNKNLHREQLEPYLLRAKKADALPRPPVEAQGGT